MLTCSGPDEPNRGSDARGTGVNILVCDDHALVRSAMMMTAAEIAPGARALVPTGVAIALPPGHEAQVRPRSGLALRHGITVLNSPGTIDADYRGEVGVILVNLSAEPFRISRGMRIAQLVVARHARAVWQEVSQLDRTARGAGGFGSTGVKAEPQRK